MNFHKPNFFKFFENVNSLHFSKSTLHNSNVSKLADEEKPEFFANNIPYSDFFLYGDYYEHNPGKKKIKFCKTFSILQSFKYLNS